MNREPLHLDVVVVAPSVRGSDLWLQVGDDLVSIRTVLDEKAAIEVARSSTDLVAVVTDDVAPPADFVSSVRAAVNSPDLIDVRWLAISSSGFAATDGSNVDHIVYPDGPFVAPHGPHRASHTGLRGLTLLKSSALRELDGSSVGSSLDGIVSQGYKTGMVALTSPLLAPVALRSNSPRAQVEPLPEADLSRVLLKARPTPSITAVMRTSGARPELARRALASLAYANAASPLDRVLVVSVDRDAAVRVASTAPASLKVETIVIDAGPVPDRTAMMVSAIQAATTDYIWFLDDDDVATSQASIRIRNAIETSARPIVIGATAAFEEHWIQGKSAPEVRSEVRAHNPYEWHRAFSGWNFVPNCGMVIPVPLAKAATRDVEMARDLGEDFALQILVLTSPGASVSVAPQRIAEISVRPGGDNTITAEDRLEWQRNMSAFLHDIASSPSVRTHALWKLGESIRDIEPRQWDGTAGQLPQWSIRQKVVWSLLPHDLRKRIRRITTAFR